ncbi:MAG: hypothetical protein OXC83_00505 [Chloroflexi bacterium]|nr:hypothetical protein [Chloroflexota bacterium]
MNLYVVNDNIPANSVRVHLARCDRATERAGVGWSKEFNDLESAIIFARQLNRRDAKGCYWCIRVGDLTRPMNELLEENRWR